MVASLSSDTVISKQKIAQEVMTQLQSARVHLSGKSFLDVGSGYGFNAEALQNSGAIVFGVEPDAEACAFAIQTGKLDKNDAYCGRLQDMPTGFAKNVDIAGVFLWNIPRGEYDEVLRALALTITQQGMVIIGLYDEDYIADPWGLAVEPHANRYFGEVRSQTFQDVWNKRLLFCTKPLRR